jgi:hypothetical protein
MLRAFSAVVAIHVAAVLMFVATVEAKLAPALAVSVEVSKATDAVCPVVKTVE